MERNPLRSTQRMMTRRKISRQEVNQEIVTIATSTKKIARMKLPKRMINP